jgi:hypothetical protein
MRDMVRDVVFSFLILLSLAGLACSKEPMPVTPLDNSQAEQVVAQTDSDGHHLLYYSLIYADPASLDFTIVPIRDVATHFNILNWLEKGPCTNCVTVTNVQKLLNNDFLVSLRITHPFPSTNFTGFDLRGILMFTGSQTFPIAGLTASSIYKNDAELVNADGFTALYNYSTLGQSFNDLQSYQQGNMSIGIPNSTVNGYKRYSTNEPSNTRNYFLAGTQITADYEIHFSTTGPFVLGYAVDASWALPTEIPATDPVTDFPPAANCPEPWKVVVTEDPLSNTLTNLGGSATLTIDVYDYQGKDSYKAPTVECPELFTGLLPGTFVQSFPGYDRWSAVIYNTTLAGGGRYRALVKVEDNDNDSAPDYLDLTAYQMPTIKVTWQASLGGWARNWGGSNPDSANDSVTDSAGNIYITGSFTMECDFDPGPGDATRTANFLDDAYLVKYDPNGNFQWVGTWGGEADAGNYVAMLGNNIIVYGTFMDIGTDFDPGPDTDNHDSNGGADLFLNVFDSAGNQLWAVTWGSDDYDYAGGMFIDEYGRIYVGGTFIDSVDFNPGPGTALVNSNGGYDSFLMRLASNGNYQYVRTWGGPEDDYVKGIGGTLSGDAWVTGYFQNTVDFNPGTGVDNHTSIDLADAFVSRFDFNGNFKWAKTWGGNGDDIGFGVQPDSMGNCCITGEFETSVDFDPGPGTVMGSSAGDMDIFILNLDQNGLYKWSGTMGSTYYDGGRAVEFDPLGNLYVAGHFSETVDLDPGPGVVMRSSGNGTPGNDTDLFLLKLTSANNYIWVDTWGGGESDYAAGLYIDLYGRTYFTGQFYNEADLNPGSGEDIHVGGGLDAFITTVPASGSW